MRQLAYSTVSEYDNGLCAKNPFMKVYPVNFSTKHREMLGYAKLLLERGRVAINPKFHKLVTSLSTAVDNEGSLDKQLTSYSDIFDAFRLSLQNYYFREDR